MTTDRPARRTPIALGVAALAVACFGVLALLAATPATAADQTQATPSNGVVIRWNLANQQFEAPSAEQSARLYAELQRRLAGDVSAKAGFASGPMSVETLPNGMVRARLPFDLLNLSIVRVGTDGSFAESCTQGSPEGVDLTTAAKTTATRWEER